MKWPIAIICILAMSASTMADGLLGPKVYAPDYASVDYYTYPRYAFEYAVRDPHTGDNKAQWETRDGDVVKGAYSLVEPDGSIRIVEYRADDKTGFNAIVKRIGPNLHPATALPLYKAPLPTIGYKAELPISVGSIAGISRLANAPLLHGAHIGDVATSTATLLKAPSPVIAKEILPGPIIKEPWLSLPIIKEPILPYLIKEPILQYPIKEPILPYPIKDPALPYPIKEPVPPYPIKGPIFPYPIKEPVLPYPIKGPIFPYPIKEPVLPYPIKEPILPYPILKEPIRPYPIIKEPVFPFPITKKPVWPQSVIKTPIYPENYLSSVLKNIGLHNPIYPTYPVIKNPLLSTPHLYAEGNDLGLLGKGLLGHRGPYDYKGLSEVGLGKWALP